MFDFIVIGKGLIGSAAFHHLSKQSANTLLIGPGEPADKASHEGVFASHYDNGRLTHLHGQSPTWGELCRRSIARYREIEQKSGLDYYYPVGELYVVDPTVDNGYNDPENIAYSRKHLGVDLFPLTPQEQRQQIPTLAFPSDSLILWEKTPAGHINPRIMCQAHVALGQQAGGQVVTEMVIKTEDKGSFMQVTTQSGQQFEARRVLVATGSFANGYDVLPEKLPLLCKTEVIILGEVSEEEADRLKEMPVLHYDLASDRIANIYMIRPIRYPNGCYYIKLGANSVRDQFLDTLEEKQAWFQSGDGDALLEDLKTAVLQLVPNIQVKSWHTDRCMITRTPTKYPIIKPIISEKLYVAVGGNGSSAACADALGELAANLLIHNEWRDSLDENMFQ